MTPLPIPWLQPEASIPFPHPSKALREPNGLLALGGDLSCERLREAYRHGIFPWFSTGEPILWWSPDPRCVFRTDGVHASRSLRKLIRRSGWVITIDRAFEAVMRGCAAPRAEQHGGTWILETMIDAYVALHRQGDAHSIEVWHGDQLVGGLYGVASGAMFAGESMFSAVSGGSKVALTCLAALLRSWNFPWLDAQVGNPHLYRMGAIDMPRADYLRELETLRNRQPAEDAFDLPQAIAAADLV